MIIFGASTLGEATLHACRAKGIPVDCFVDHRITGSVMGLPVLTLDKVKGWHNFYLTSPNIEDMITPLKEAGFRDWKSCGDVLEGFDISGLEFEGYSNEHVKYLISTALHHHENYMRPERLTVQSVDLMITEKCSMKCKDCSNLMQYYEHPENADLDVMYKMIDGLVDKMDEVYEFRVIGGEPFMHKQIHLVLDHVVKMEKVNKVSIFTNATIVPRETQWASLTHPKIRLFITDYDELSRNIKPLIAELDKRGIAYVSEKANNWTDSASLVKHNRTVDENKALWKECCAKNLATLADGRLYRCPFAANAFKLKAVPDYKSDYLEIATTSREDVRRFLREKDYIETCDHCNGRSYSYKTIEPAIQVTKPLKFVRYVHGS
jgi:MoaA/NifB/PqqE/SkfB family radical SAM enzyme